MRGMLRKKRQFLENGTLKVDKNEEDMASIQQLHEAQMQALDQKKKEQGIDDRDSQADADDEEKQDPKEIAKQMQIMNAERRREEWIRHQTDAFNDFKDQDAVFRKGVHRGTNAAHHDFRGTSTE